MPGYSSNLKNINCYNDQEEYQVILLLVSSQKDKPHTCTHQRMAEQPPGWWALHSRREWLKGDHKNLLPNRTLIEYKKTNSSDTYILRVRPDSNVCETFIAWKIHQCHADV